MVTPLPENICVLPILFLKHLYRLHRLAQLREQSGTVPVGKRVRAHSTARFSDSAGRQRACSDFDVQAVADVGVLEVRASSPLRRSRRQLTLQRGAVAVGRAAWRSHAESHWLLQQRLR